MHGLRLPGPALERKIGRSVEGKHHVGAEKTGGRVQHAPRPGIEGMGLVPAVVPKGSPQRWTGVADEYGGARVSGHAILWPGVKPAPGYEARCG